MSIVNYVPKGLGRHQSGARSQNLRDIGRWQTRTRALRKLLVGIMPLAVMVLSCQSSNLGSRGSWNTYRNQRYNFEFPYPSNWVSVPMPDNGDGGAFRDPQNPSVEIRGWAANKLSATVASSAARGLYKREHRFKNKASSLNDTAKDSQKSQQQNFTTEQGLEGKLEVELGSDISLMRLTLSQGKVQYHWQGQSDSKQFVNYYRFFYYVASKYRISPPQKQ